MKTQQIFLSPLDVVILLKIVALGNNEWFQSTIANSLFISQSEVSKSISRTKFAGLMDASGKKVSKLALMDVLQYGIRYIFPQQAGAMVRGIATAHSAPPLNSVIKSEEFYVWPSAKGNLRGQCIIPLYPTVVEAVKQDETLYAILALVDAIRVGRAREKEMAIEALKKYILDGE